MTGLICKLNRAFKKCSEFVTFIPISGKFLVVRKKINHMKTSSSFFAMLALLLFFSGCSTLRTKKIDPQPDLLSGQWEMISWKDFRNLEEAFPSGVPNFNIEADKGTITGFNGCNQLQGKLRYDRQTGFLQFYTLASTKIFCNTVPELDLTNSLTRVNHYKVTQEKLVLMVDEKVVMEFKRVVENK